MLWSYNVPKTIRLQPKTTSQTVIMHKNTLGNLHLIKLVIMKHVSVVQK